MKKRLNLLICLVLAAALLSGCQWFHEYTTGGWDPQDTGSTSTESLPTLPAGSDTSLIPMDVFTDYVEYTPPDLSDDGSMLLYRHLGAYSDDIIAENRQTGEQTLVAWPSESAGNPYFMWAPDGETILFFVDDMGDENFGLYTSDIETGETATLFPGGDTDCYYVSDDPANDKQIFLAMFNFDTNLYDLYLVNYVMGTSRLVLKNPGSVTGYIFDRNGNLRALSMADSEAGKQIWLKKSIGLGGTTFINSEWNMILSWDYENADSSGIYGFMQDGKRLLYIDSSAKNTSALYTYDTETGQKTEIFNDPDYDISGTWTDLDLDEVTAVNVYSQKLEWHILDESFSSDYEALSAIGDTFDIIDSNADDHYWIVAYLSDVKEEDYYLYDMETQQASFLFNAQPDLEQYDFVPLQPISFAASDGLEIEGYATFPVGEDKGNLPTVVLVHGGPWARDTWEYNPEVQLLASRGYLVLQVNFRGSSGYGKDFLRAGDKEWGGLMHQDILDAVSYAVGKGWTDADRVGVYGASYGGYEALICAAFSSGVFKCAVDAFGPSSLLTFIESIPEQWSVEYQSLVRSIGDPETDADLLKKRSPLYYAEDMKIPMMVVQGENDVRVKQQESDQMVDALKKAGVPVTYLLFPNTGHGFNTTSARKQFYSEMESFFAEYLGGAAEKTDSSAQDSDIQNGWA